jgi:two-component system, cell cycle response regulator
LTGFYNRQFLIELLEKEWARSQRYGYTLSIIMTEIDDFKKINDRYGHQIGDTALKQIAEILYENLRKNDYLARYGGAEFLFVLPQADPRDAYNAAERFRRAVREYMMSFDKNDRLWLSISCGVCTAHPKRKDENVIASIQKADNALNEAKRLGKDRIVSYGVNHHSS